MMNVDRRYRVIVALSLGPAVANSFARFAYALVLPAMRSELGLTYSQAGGLNTANALGYLLGAMLSARYASRDRANKRSPSSKLRSSAASPPRF